ncbi:phosphotransferase [Arthrobacter sp. UC242_113]|uniref:phosphotransferase n=1 Tax=Arthrobacter sp. UC242_113 TaxID=3374550 RepID=UPI003757FFA3
MDEHEAVRHVRQLWGLHTKARRLATEKDDTFALEDEAGSKFVVKVSNPSEDESEIGFEVSLLQHVAAEGSVPVPALLPSWDGETLVTFLDDAGQLRRARIMSLIPGIALDSTDSSPVEREKVGEVLARLRGATASFSHPAEHRLLVWDVRHAGALNPLLDEVRIPWQRELLEEGLGRFADIAGRLEGLRSQVLHNDFSKSNIFVEHGHPDFVRGIIDFGDAVHTAIAVDVSTALLNQLPRFATDEPAFDLFGPGRDLLRGYLRHADLTPEEFSIIPHLVMGRVVSRALITLHRAALFPGNSTYILRNTEQGWNQLKWFLARSPEQVSQTLMGNA